MLRVLDRGSRLCDGLTRREWLRIGSIGLGGLTLSALTAGRAAAAAQGIGGGSFGRAKSVILFGLIGGPCQLDTWDPKPDAPVEIRGEFGSIATRTPGLRCGELMPRTAALTDKLAVLRAMVTGDNAHSSSGYQMLTGVPHIPPSVENAPPKAPNNMPSVGGIVRALRPGRGQLPAAITLPRSLSNVGNFPWPGQDAGVLGQQYNPWLIEADPSEPNFRVPALKLPQELAPLRFDERRTLLEQMNGHLADLARAVNVENYDQQATKAIDLLSSSKTRSAFDLSQESDATRDRYGRGRFAQSVLLARRLVEAGVSLIQVNWTAIDGHPNKGSWDTHETHNQSAKSLLMPMMDQTFSALILDLEQRGLLAETLVVWLGEFGRTPKFNAKAGRDHWGSCFSLAAAGGGIRGGQVVGSSDHQAAHPTSGRTTPADLWATVFHCLGYTPETVVHDTQNRPLPLSRGRVIEAIV